MNRLKFFLPKTILLTLYNSLVLPYLNYAILNWGNSTSQCNKLFLIQKRAVRIITKTGFLAHTTPLFAELRVLKFNDLYNFNLGKFMYKYKRGLLPTNFKDLFTMSSSVHSYGTRGASKGDLYINFNRTSFSKNNLTSRGILFWNNLNVELKESRRIESFSRNLKRSIFQTY